MVFRFAIAEGLARRDPTVDLSSALAPAKPVHHMASLRADDIPSFFAKLGGYDGGEQTRVAIELMLHTMVRTADLREATWAEVGREQWRIPAARMKMSLEHIVPLTPTSRRLFDRLRELSGGSRLVVPGEKPGKPISQNTMIFALYRMGYHSKLTIHGFRRTASTILNESGLWEPDWIERQLAHVEENKVRRAYNAAQYLEHRTRMMLWWSDYLDRAKDVGELLG
jgi:integrase